MSEVFVIESDGMEQIGLAKPKLILGNGALPMKQSMTNYRGILILALVVLVSVGAFAQSDSASKPPAPAAAATDKQAARAARSDSSYVIGANDVLAINVWKEPDISRSVPVRSDGKISSCLMGELTASS